MTSTRVAAATAAMASLALAVGGCGDEPGGRPGSESPADVDAIADASPRADAGPGASGPDSADAAPLEPCPPGSEQALWECGVFGTGCAELVTEACDDGDLCTWDLCSAALGCVHVPRRCVGDGPCTAVTCEASQGCVSAARSCDGDDACTEDECDPELGCVHGPRDCDDGVACTTDGCDSMTGCVHLPIAAACGDDTDCQQWRCDLQRGCEAELRAGPCDDGDVCTVDDSCVGGGCIGGFDLPCEDADPCTDDACDPVWGCLLASRNCDDGEPCTDDHCDPALGCVHLTASCDDGDACTTDSCVPGQGCHHFEVSCKDDDPCTVDACNPQVGCDFSLSACDDGDACTEDHCEGEQECSHTPVSCVDGSVCTTEECDPEVGCTWEPTFPKCDKSTGCTVDYCHPLLGCIKVKKHCVPDDPCLELDECLSNCQFKPRTCDDGNPCTFDACEPGEGCVHFHGNPCDDGNTLTEDVCISKVGCSFELHGDPICEVVGGEGDVVLCSVEVVRPDDSITPVPTSPLASLQFDLHWDNVALELLGFEDDLVLPTGESVLLEAPPMPLSSGHTVLLQPAHPSYGSMNAQGRVRVLVFHMAVPNMALSSALVSADGEVQGDPEVMRIRFRLLSEVPPEDPTQVRISEVSGGIWDATPVPVFVEAMRITQQRRCAEHEHCDDGDACTEDFCLLVNGGPPYCFNAEFIDYTALGPDWLPCLEYSCDPLTGEISSKPRVCDDGDACTFGVCVNEVSCDFFPVDPDDGDPCTVDYCDTEHGVFNVPANCNDGKNCTIDQCIPEIGCVNTPIDCDDGVPCTIDYCLESSWCKHDADHAFCDDGDPTTQDFCSPLLPEADGQGCLHVSGPP